MNVVCSICKSMSDVRGCRKVEGRFVCGRCYREQQYTVKTEQPPIKEEEVTEVKVKQSNGKQKRYIGKSKISRMWVSENARALIEQYAKDNECGKIEALDKLLGIG